MLIHHLFEQQAIKIPNTAAVQVGGAVFAYSDLNLRANQLAIRILESAPDSQFIGVSSSRSIDTIVSLLAVLKAGKAYVPLNPHFPEARLKEIVSDSGISLCICTEKFKVVFEALVPNVLIPEESDILGTNIDNLGNIDATSVDLAYVLYTSGSTGKPKGVCIAHQSIVNLISWHKQLSPYLVTGDKTLQFSPLEFDVSVMEIFCTLCTGGTLVLIDEEIRLDPDSLLKYIDEQNIARLSLPFVALQYITSAAVSTNFYPKSLKEIITAGEQLKITPQLVKFFSALPNCTFYNLYGPTEASVFTSGFKLIGAPANWPLLPPIGKPIDNVELVILDDTLNEVVDGAEGELCISGINLATGYLNAPKLTDSVFLNWINKYGIEKRIYRSGDICKRLPDGNIHYIGRKDTQVKIRGNRVELGEIEVCLNSFDVVKQSVVIAEPDVADEKRLIAYIVPADGYMDILQLRKEIAKVLPEFMIPAAFVQVERFALTSNGKVDRNNLPKPGNARPDLPVLFSASVGETEHKIASLWGELLELDKIGRNDNFFDLGGNSLLVIKSAAQMKLRYGFFIPVAKLYQHQTVAAVASYLDNNELEVDFDPVLLDRKPSDKDIAVVGMAMRFPGAENLNELWDLLSRGEESVSFFADQELDPSIQEGIKNRDNYVKARGILADAEGFDASFFNINPKLAALMDPQHRVFLEIAWEALETSGHHPGIYPGVVGVFAGSGNNSYYTNNVLTNPDLIANVGSFLVSTLNEKDYLATRVAFELNLNGPAVSVNAASATSLLAIAQAAESIRNGYCDVALAGGVSITSPIKSGHLYEDGAMFSADGHCRPFDENATGTVFSDGAGVVVLKSLKQAKLDGDVIYVVLKGIGLNNDGGDKGSFTAPSAVGQAGAIAMALADAGFEASSIGYVEAHGTATPLGDPIEIEGLKLAFGKQPTTQFCAIGSIKSNMGHLVAAAGVAGFIKATLALHFKKIPASLFYKKPNPNIDFATSPFYVNTRLRDWENSVARRAGVSSFGVGGTNLHTVLEEYQEEDFKVFEPDLHRLFCLSAASEFSLQSNRKRLQQFTESNSEASLIDIAYNLNVNRIELKHRCFVVAEDREDLQQALEGFTTNGSNSNTLLEQPDALVFMFPGQGSQYPEMGSALYTSELVYREAVNECLALLNCSFSELQQQIRTGTQVAMFVTSYSLARLWMSWGVLPAVFVGHSIGEFVAAHLAGVFSLSDALKLITSRAALINTLPEGSMLAVRMGVVDLKQLLPKGLDIAAVNSDRLCVVAGDKQLIADFAASLEQQQVASGLLQTSHAFHSSMMDPIVDRFAEIAKEIAYSVPKTPLVSTVNGTWMSEEDAVDPFYWAAHLRNTVRFAEAIDLLTTTAGRVFLEVGPGRTLSTLVLQQAKGKHAGVVGGIEATEKMAEYPSLLTASGQLWLNGVDLNWKAFYSNIRRPKLTLNSYAFDHKQYWLEPGIPQSHGEVKVSNTPTAFADVADEENSLRAQLVKVFEDASGIDISALSPSTTFAEAGFDSLILTQIASRLKNSFHVEVTFRKLFSEYNTITLLTELLQKSGAAKSTDGLTVFKSPLPDLTSEELAESSKPFGATARIEKKISVLTAKQQSFIEGLIKSYTDRTQLSKLKTQQDRLYMADPRVVSGFRPLTKELVYPIIVERSKGSRLYDIDGNEYIDALNGFGSNMLGYQPDFIKEALHQQIEKGYEIGPQHELAGEVCKLLSEFTGFERVALCNTGSEAVLGAMRIARSITGKSLIVAFSGSYHGIIDEVIVRGTKSLRTIPAASGIMPEAVQNMLILDYGTEESLKIITERANEIAAVLVEPVQSRRPEFRPVTFLKELREITIDAKIALVFDEVITGFRMHPGGAQALFNIKADLATYGKVIGGGLSIGIIAGQSYYMDALDGGHWQYGDQSVPEIGVTYFAGTFVRHPLALAAAKASLNYLKEKGPSLQRDLTLHTEQMTDRMNAICLEKRVPLVVVGFGSLWRLKFTEEIPYSELLFTLMRLKGIHIIDGFPCFITAAHTIEDTSAIVNAFEESVDELLEAGFLSIDKRGSTVVPATESQLEIWTSCLIGGPEASCAYNDSFSLRLNGKLSDQALSKAIQAVCDKHEALRTVFSADGEQIIIKSVVPVEIYRDELAQVDASHRDRIVEHYLFESAHTAFDLESGPLFRFALFELAVDEHLLVVTVHHIICDGWSIGVLMQNLGTFYNAFLTGESVPLTVVPAFSDYALDENRFEHTAKYKENERFWLNQFRENTPVMDLPTDNPRPALRTYNSKRADFVIEVGVKDAITDLARRLGVSFVGTLIAAFEVFLHRMTGNEEVIFGLPTAGQVAAGTYGLIGHCVNLLAIGSKVDPGESFENYLVRRSSEMLEAYDHQQYTFGKLLKQLNIPRDASRLPLVPVIFNVELGMDEAVAFEGLTHTYISNPRAYETFEIFLNISDHKDGLVFEWSYNIQLFKTSTIAGMMQEFDDLLKQIITKPDTKIIDIPTLHSEQFLAKLEEINDTAKAYPKELSLYSLIQQTANQYPQHIALEFEEEQYTYAELMEKANRVACIFIKHGLKPGQVVGIALERSSDLLFVILAVMRAGAVYLPIDPSFPASRKTHMLSDSGAVVLVTSDLFSGEVDFSGSKLSLEDIKSELVDYAFTSKSIEVNASGKDLLYILYTSGSTGTPKGVKIANCSVVNLLLSMQPDFGMEATDRLLAVTTVSFDISVLELFLPLVCGASVVLASTEAARDGRLLLDIIRRKKITIMQATPNTWRILLESGWNVENIRAICGGEELPLDLAQQILQRARRLWNVYGPTETTVWSTIKEITTDTSVISIGKPIANTSIYILDRYQKPVAAGVAGEIYIAGDGIAEGYINLPELNKEKFLDNTFSASGSGKMYRTGDIGKYTENGEFLYLSRIDAQLKIRGFRIEAGEVEYQLSKLDGVKSSVVLARADKNGNKLIAYVVLNDIDTELSSSERHGLWRERLRRHLPDYMIPDAFAEIKKMPLTQNGKIDKNALLAINLRLADVQSSFVAPRTDVEQMISDIWSEVLELDKISIYDNFFELGGHSLTAVKVMTMIEAETGKRLPLAILFEHSTIERLALSLYLDGKSVTWDSLVPIKPKGTKVPIYIVHGAGLNVLLFNTLATHMDPEQPVYGLQARGLNGIDEPLDRIEAIAAHYISEIRARNPSGPYALAGYSFGGIVAFEMAKQLEAQNFKVIMLAMFDTYAYRTPHYDPAVIKYINKGLYFFRKIWHTVAFKEGFKSTINNRAATLKKKMQYHLAMLFKKQSGQGSTIDHSFKVDKANNIASKHYRIVPYPISIELFRAETKTFHLDDFEFMGWKPYALKGINVHSIPGEHNTIFMSPNDKKFAAKLQDCLDKASGK
ncbi:amino acid adenylation domain-containing protein [Pedobacter sp. PWIIR3]